jgi:long-chain acyl-CoA synthetase
MQHRSILELFLRNAEEHPEATAALVKRGGAYQDVTWRELAEQARAVAAGLVALGVSPGDRVCIVANTRLEWVACDLGILGAGGVTVPIYPSNLSDECQHVCADSGAVAVIAEDAAQVEKLRAERGRLPSVKRVIQLTGAPTGDDWVMSHQQLVELGKGVSVEELAGRRASLDGDSILTIIYTSGTTGRPKGVMTTHANMLYEAQCLVEVDIVRPDDVQLLFLPLAHTFAKVLEIGWFGTRHIMAFAESMETVKANLLEVRPTFICGVPRLFEKVHAAVVQKALAVGGVKAALFEAACRLSTKKGEAELAGRSLSLADSLVFAALERLVFAKLGAALQQALGGRMRLMVSGGAPLSRAINWFFRDAGITIFEGYGLTETSAGSVVNRPGRQKIGTVGTPLPGTEVKIAEDGEVLLRGPGVMRGYWNNPTATSESIKDGWFHTGDIGLIDADGYLRITDRKKDIIITAGGKNVAPQNIENMLKAHSLVSQAVVHGDRRKYLTALVTIDPEALKRFAGEHGLASASYAELTQHPELSRAVQLVIDDVNARLPQHETIKKWKVLQNDFTQETGELTPTLKIKRKVINDRYRQVFDGFYDEVYN